MNVEKHRIENKITEFLKVEAEDREKIAEFLKGRRKGSRKRKFEELMYVATGETESKDNRSRRRGEREEEENGER